MRTRRWIVTGVIVFLLCQLLLWQKGWAGGGCMQSLSGPSEGDHAYIEWVQVGFPLSYLVVKWVGCFEGRTSSVEWQLWNLAADMLLFAGLGAGLYGLTRLWNRFRQHRADGG